MALPPPCVGTPATPQTIGDPCPSHDGPAFGAPIHAASREVIDLTTDIENTRPICTRKQVGRASLPAGAAVIEIVNDNDIIPAEPCMATRMGQVLMPTSAEVVQVPDAEAQSDRLLMDLWGKVALLFFNKVHHFLLVFYMCFVY